MSCIGSCFSCIGNTIYYIINFIFMIIGIALLSGGTILLVSFECTIEKLVYQFFTAIGLPVTGGTTQDAGELTVNINTAAIILLSIGAGLVVFSMFAFIGAAAKAIEKIVVFLYILISLALFGGFIFLIIFFAINPRPAELDLVSQTLNLFMYSYKPITGSTSDIQIEDAVIDTLQSALHCCGVSGVGDYGSNGIANQVSRNSYNMTLWGGVASQKITVPPTCCRTDLEISKGNDYVAPPAVSYFPTPATITPGCYDAVTLDPRLVHTTRSCSAAVYELVDENLTWILIATSVAAAVCLLIVFALCAKLCCCNSKKSNGNKSSKAENGKSGNTTVVVQPVPAVAYPGYPQYPGYPGYPGVPQPSSH